MSRVTLTRFLTRSCFRSVSDLRCVFLLSPSCLRHAGELGDTPIHPRQGIAGLPHTEKATAILFQLSPRLHAHTWAHTLPRPRPRPGSPTGRLVLVFVFLGFWTSITFSDFDPISCLCLHCHFFDSSFRTNVHVSTTSILRRLWSTPPLPCRSSSNKAAIIPKHFGYGNHCEFHSECTI